MDNPRSTDDSFQHDLGVILTWRPGLIFLAFFFAINFLTISRTPLVGPDEVYFVDPAINLIRGEGLISRAWSHSPETRIVSSTSILFSLALAPWMTVFGQSLLAIRMFGVTLVGLGMLFLWMGLRRWRIAISPGWLLGLSTALVCAYGFGYRTVRPESLLFLIATVLFYVSAWSPSPVRTVLLFLIGLSVPFAGQVACVVFTLFLGLLVVQSRKRCRRLCATIVGGMMAGALGLISVYKGLGIWEDFLMAVNTEGGTPLQRLLRRLTSNPLAEHRNVVPKDLSMIPTYMGLLWLVYLEWRRRSLRWESPILFGLIYAIFVPVVLYLTGKFPTYYTWMVVFPLLTIICVWSSREEKESGSVKLAPRFFVGLACVVGHPFLLTLSIHDWRDLDYARVDSWVKGVIKPDDVALISHSFYYAAKPIASKVYLQAHVSLISPEDAQKLTVLILPPHSIIGPPREYLLSQLGPDWQPTGEKLRSKPSIFGNDGRFGGLSLPNYDGDVYRRSRRDETTAPAE